MRESNVGRSVLVIAAHPDDEILGCGGTVALHTSAGDRVTALLACEGESLRYGSEGVGQRANTFAAAGKLGVADVRLLNFPDQRLDTVTLTDLITPIENAVEELQPAVVYCQWGGDINRDHQILFDATLVATRPTVPCIEAVYAFDTASSTEWGYPRNFVPDTWMDITSTIERKLSAMACYESELRGFPHPRSLEALRHRAAAWGSQCCMHFAEVFMTVRRTIRNGQARI